MIIGLLLLIIIGVGYTISYIQDLHRDLRKLHEEMDKTLSYIKSDTEVIELTVEMLAEDVNQLAEVRTRKEIEFENRNM